MEKKKKTKQILNKKTKTHWFTSKKKNLSTHAAKHNQF